MTRAAFVLLALSLAPTIALAQEEPVAPHPSQEPWYALFQAGVEHLREERFEEAAEAFRASYQLEARVATMCNLALSYDRWGGHRTPALHAYRTCARDDESGRFRAFAERRVGEIERELALTEARAAEPRPPEGSVAPPAPAVASTDDAHPPPAVSREPDHALLFAGVGVGAVAVAAVVTAAILAVDAQATLDALLVQLGDERTIVRGSPEHQRLEDARGRATAATALYVVSGIAGAAAIAMIAADLAIASAGDADVTVTGTPGGAQLRVRAAF